MLNAGQWVLPKTKLNQKDELATRPEAHSTAQLNGVKHSCAHRQAKDTLVIALRSTQPIPALMCTMAGH